MRYQRNELVFVMQSKSVVSINNELIQPHAHTVQHLPIQDLIQYNQSCEKPRNMIWDSGHNYTCSPTSEIQMNLQKKL